METITKRRHVILDRAAFLEKGFKIPNAECFMWTQMKQNYDKHIKRMENWKDIATEEDWASKARLVPLFFIKCETSMLDVMLEFFNTFLFKGADIYFGHRDKVYVFNNN